MMFDGINLFAVLAAAIISFVFGAVWYGVLGKAWMKAAELSETRTRPGPSVMVFAFACQLVLALVFTGIVFHTGAVNLRGGLISAVMVWLGIVMTTQIVNHRFQGKPWSLTLIDGGHWLGVLLLQGAVIGMIG